MKRECEAGRRWYHDTQLGEQYQQVLAFDTDASPSDVLAMDRSLGSFVSPRRPGRVVDVLNAVVREVGACGESWAWSRVARFASGLQQEARQRE